MSNRILEKKLRRELEALNDQIDEKIIKGLSYVRESRRHKFIVNSLANIRRTSGISSNWLNNFLVKTFSFAK
jgi:hypothetical protein